jgi:hypothetical protein
MLSPNLLGGKIRIELNETKVFKQKLRAMNRNFTFYLWAWMMAGSVWWGLPGIEPGTNVSAQPAPACTRCGPPACPPPTLRIVADRPSVCVGETVRLTAEGTFFRPISDNFSTDTLNPELWDKNETSGLRANGCGSVTAPGASGGDYLYFNADLTFPRMATTKWLNTSSGCVLSFFLRYGTDRNGTGCGDPTDESENVKLQYQIDGFAWIDIENYTTGGIHNPTRPGPFDRWSNRPICIPLTPELKQSRIRFRWVQPRHDGRNQDNWMLDDVVIDVLDNSATYAWTPAVSLDNPASRTPRARLFQNTTFRVVATNACGTSNASVSITVDSLPKGGKINGTAATLCPGQPSGTLTLRESTGSILQWEQQPNCSGLFGFIPNTGLKTTYQPETLKVTTCFRALAFNGCGTAFSDTFRISVRQLGQIAGPVGLCYTQVDSIGLTGLSPECRVVGWESSPNPTTGWRPVANSQNRLNLLIRDTSSTRVYYRAVLNCTGCNRVNTEPIYIDSLPITGKVSPDTVQACAGAPPTPLVSSGYSGTLLRWEQQPGCFGEWFPISNTKDTLSLASIDVTTCYRTVIGTACGERPSAASRITVLSDGVFNSGRLTVCIGQPVPPITITGNNCPVLYWEESPNLSGPYRRIANTSNTLSGFNITQRRFYRAVVQCPGCEPKTKGTFLVEVEGNANNDATIAVAQTSVCRNSTMKMVPFTVTNFQGTILYWEYSTNCNATQPLFQKTEVASSVYFHQDTLKESTCFRARIRPRACSEFITPTVLVNVANCPAPPQGRLADVTVCYGDSATIALAGQPNLTPALSRWTSSLDSLVNYSPINNDNKANFTQRNVVTKTFYRVLFNYSNSPYGETISTIGRIIPKDRIQAGAAVAPALVCRSSASGIIRLQGQDPTASIARWESFRGCGTTSTPVAGTGTSINFVNLDTTTCYHAVISKGGCNAYSAAAKIEVNPVTVGGVINGGTTYCSVDTPGLPLLRLRDHVGIIRDWEVQANCTGAWRSLEWRFDEYAPTEFPKGNTCYRAKVKSGVCDSAFSTPDTISWIDAPGYGIIENDTAVCEGDTTLFSVRGNGAPIAFWEYSFTCGADIKEWIEVPQSRRQTEARLGPLLDTVCIRTVMQLGECITRSESSRIRVAPPTVAGTPVPEDTSLCVSGDRLARIELVGTVGRVVQWEMAEKCDSRWNIIGFPNIRKLVYGPIPDTLCLRALIKSGVCDTAYTDSIRFNLDSLSQGGKLSGPLDSICIGDSAGVLVLDSTTAELSHWEYSLDCANFTNPIRVPSTGSDSLNLGLLFESRCYRAVLKGKGSCPPAFSDTLRISVGEVDSAIVLLGSKTICEGETSGILEIDRYTGTVIRWEFSTDCQFFSNPQKIDQQVTRITSNPLSRTTCFRAVLADTTCRYYSTTVRIDVQKLTVAGTISANQTICFGGTAQQLELTGQIGQVVRWEASKDNGATWTDMGKAGQTIYTPVNLTVNTWFRAVVANFPCPQRITPPVIITVTPRARGGLITPFVTTICAETAGPTLSLAGVLGRVIYWERSIDGGLTWNSIRNTARTFDVGVLPAITSTEYRFRAVVKNGNCDSVFSGQAIVLVEPAPIPGRIVGSSTTVCIGVNSGVMTLASVSGRAEWQSSTDNGASWQSIPGTLGLTSITSDPLFKSTWFRAIVRTSPACSADTSTIYRITVVDRLSGGAVRGKTTFCIGRDDFFLTLRDRVGPVLRWEFSDDNFRANVRTILNNTDSLRITGITDTFWYRAVVASGTCSEAFSATHRVISYLPPTLTAAPRGSCSGTGEINAQALGGTGKFYYYLTNESDITDVRNNRNGRFINIPNGRYTVTAIDSVSGCTAQTNVVLTSILEVPVIQTPFALSRSTATIRWTRILGENVRYRLYYRVVGDSRWVTVGPLVDTITNVVVQRDSDYEAYVEAICQFGTENQSISVSSQVNFRTPVVRGCDDLAPEAPGGIVVHSITANSAVVRWSPVAGLTPISGYIVSFGPETVNPLAYSQFTVCHPTTSFNMTGLIPNIRYRVRVRTNCTNCTTALQNQDNRSPWSGLFRFDTRAARLGDAQEDGELSSLLVYPNPSQAWFTLVWNSSDEQANLPMRVELVNLAGQVVLSDQWIQMAGKNSQLVATGNLASGIYQLQCSDGTRLLNTRIVIE